MMVSDWMASSFLTYSSSLNSSSWAAKMRMQEMARFVSITGDTCEGRTSNEPRMPGSMEPGNITSDALIAIENWDTFN
eukprot:1093421-Prorocentrum_minimum.AAC.1